MAAGQPPNSPLLRPPAESGADVSVPWERIERFIGQLAHDVRNGLNAVELQLTFLGEISTDPEAVDEVKRLRGTLLEITRQLQTIKVASSPVHPHPLEYPATDLLEDLRERLERLHPERVGQVTWTVAMEPGAAVLVDPDLTITGMLELFANAFRFGGSNIRGGASNDAASVTLTLQETPLAPPAVDPERWGHEPLFSTRRGAYGLGLFRVHRIMESQCGSLRAMYSAADNTLTTLVTLPRPGGGAVGENLTAS